MDLNKQFENAIESLKKLDSVSNDNKLSLYGYYKQATVGTINISKPSFWNRVAVAKWNAWNNCKDMTSEDAKKNYIELVKLLLE